MRLFPSAFFNSLGSPATIILPDLYPYPVDELVNFINIIGCQENGCDLLVYLFCIIQYSYPTIKIEPECRLVNKKTLCLGHKPSWISSLFSFHRLDVLLEYSVFLWAQPSQEVKQPAHVLQFLAYNKVFHDILESPHRHILEGQLLKNDPSYFPYFFRLCYQIILPNT